MKKQRNPDNTNNIGSELGHVCTQKKNRAVAGDGRKFKYKHNFKYQPRRILKFSTHLPLKLSLSSQEPFLMDP
jgi:hypothetical protein